MVCGLVALVAWIWLLVVIFQDGGILWGLGSLIIFPIVALIYVAMNWGKRVTKPFLIVVAANVVGWVCKFLG